MKTDKKKLELWQDRLAANETAWAGERAKMDEREALYLGEGAIKPIAQEDVPDRAPHVRNVVGELIEAQVNATIPQPKVTARRKEDEGLARLIEDMIRDELDRMSFEEINDLMERMVPIQGGGAYLVEWDSTKRTHATTGEIAVSAIHPKMIVPQAGVYTGIEDMDYIILKIPQTKAYIKRRYGVDVADETEEEPDIRGTEEATADDLVTQYAAYYHNGKGGIGLYSWVNDTQLEDLEDYQARRLRRCAKCGALEPAPGSVTTIPPTMDGEYPKDGEAGRPGVRPVREDSGDEAVGAAHLGGPWSGLDSPPDKREIGKPNGREVCPFCGGTKWEEREEDFEELLTPVQLTDGSVIEALEPVTGPDGTVTVRQTRIPYYKPGIFPVILQKNISVFGRFLGGSDVDTIASQQNTVNRLETKMLDKICSAGSYMSVPVDANIERNAGEMKLIRLTKPSDKTMIDVYNMEGDVSQDMAMLSQTYEEMRQAIGVTDSFQGRKDTTATSGTAKQFAAAQTAGRLESKRIMKNAAYQRLFEAIFKFKLAYADEPRPIPSFNERGERVYEQFNRYDFLKRDAAGEWYWNDQFIFSVDDTSASLAQNRQAMWEETRLNLQSGAFGDPTDIDTLIFFWTKMKLLHYPGAAETLTMLQEKKEQEAAAAQAAAEEQARIVAAQAQIDAQRAAAQTAAGGSSGTAAAPGAGDGAGSGAIGM